jgi:proteasome lid subunit RPN8/RPN11
MSGERPTTIGAEALAAVYAHAREGAGREVCGFILRGGGAPDEARRCENRQDALHAEDPVRFPRDSRTAYNLGPADLLFLDKSLSSKQSEGAGAGGRRRVEVIYHSHVDVGAYFSEEDVRAALFDGEPLYPVDYLVVDAKSDGTIGGAKLFRWDGHGFAEVATFPPER